MKNNEAMTLYLLWLDKNHPNLYAAVYDAMQSRGGLGAVEVVDPTAPVEDESWTDTITGLIKDLTPIYIATEQQKQLNDLNLERAKAGEPPLDASDASTISTQVGLSEKTRNTIMMSAGLVALGIGALAFRNQGGRKRAR